MASYPAIYRARAMQVNGAGLSAYVPQVFGESPITVTAYMGEAPTLPGMGWVMFQGGNPEFPVWMGVSAGGDDVGPGVFITRDYRWSNNTAATDPGHGFVKVNQSDPGLATQLYMSVYDRDENGYITALTLQPDDLIAVYLSGNVTTRIEYKITAPLTNNGNQWLTFPVTVVNNQGFQAAPAVPGNNVNVKVVVQVAGHAAPIQPMPGGTAGDIILKNSSAAGDSSWTKTVPALTITALTAGALTSATANLTSVTAVALASTAHALTLGVSGGSNVALGATSIQARSAGVAATLSLNPLGGTIQLGAGGTPAQQVRIGDDAYLADINVAHTMGLVSTSDTTQGNLKMGGATFRGLPTYWQLSAPAAGNGYLDANTIYLRNAAGGEVAYLNDTAMYIHGSRPFAFASYGGGWYMSDSTWIRAYGTKNIYTSQEIRCGIAYSFDAGHKIDVSGGEMRLWANTALTHFANTHQWLNAAANAWHMKYDGSTLINYNSGFQFSGAGYKLTHSTDTDTGIYYWADGSVGLIANGVTNIRTAPTGLDILAMNPGSQFRLAGPSDGNHGIEYASSYPPGSGEAANGPLYRGYSSHWMYCNNTGSQFYLSAGGNTFINAGKSYTVFSSREHKENIEPLDPDESLEMVRRWQPVEFDLIADGTHAEGFISEDHVKVTPAMVNICGPDSNRPGWANAVDVAGGTVRLAGAVQALLRRVEALEGASL